MTKDQARREIFRRAGEIPHWVDYASRGYEGASLEEAVKTIREYMPRIQYDEAWSPGNHKRRRLEEAFAVLGLGPI